MDEKTETLLRELAEKFGTTGEHLWGVMVRQAYISGVTDLFVMLAWLALFIIVFYVLYRKTKKPEPTEDNKYPSAPINDDGAVIALWGVYAAVAALFALGFGLSLSGIIGALMNPEYWALKQLLTAVN